MRRLLTIVAAAAFLAAGAARIDRLSAPEHEAINRISPDSLKANLSFLSSDALEGRGTPSQGLDIAAEFIASRFRLAGLDRVGENDSYFQNARFAEVTPKLDDFRLKLIEGPYELDLDSADVDVHSRSALDLHQAAVVRLPADDAAIPVEGKIVAGEARRYGSEAALARLQARKPALILLFTRRQLDAGEHSYLAEAESADAPVLRVFNEDAVAALTGKENLSVSIHLSAPAQKHFVLRNVAGMLRGSDPVLRNQYLIVTAHYDHLGMRVEGGGDRIYNGANDNGSGTVSVIEMAAALSTLHPRPKRSILFMAVFGEEEGLLGAYYYTHHPLVPLKDTVANINLEQMGRTDDNSGRKIGAFAFTGPSYSDLPAAMEVAAESEGVKIYKPADADAFFERSDNYAFALAGIVAHTVVVAFEYPDYHGLADEWQKIDYGNMAIVDKGVAAGILEIADSAAAPKWSDIRQTALYRDTRK